MSFNFEERLSGSPFVDRIWRTQSERTGDFLSVAASQWEKPTLIKENLSEEIAKLKAQPGKNIGVCGSPTLVRSLLRDGSLDELQLMIHPVILGKVKRLFTEDLDLKRLKLVDSKVTGTGIVIATYQPATSETKK